MSNGPITDPRRSPDIASSKVLLILFKLAHCCLLFKYE